MACLNFVKKFYVFFLIFFIGLALRIYALSGYVPLHIDEPCTFAVSTSANQLDKGVHFKENWNKFNFAFGKEYRSKDIQKAFFEGGKSVSSIVDDLLAMRNNNIDRQHPTLYYSIIRFWNLSLGEFDPQGYVEHARNLNLVLYLIAFFFMFKLLQLIKNDDWFIALGLFFAFVNSGAIMLDTMAREYSLMTALFIVVTYLTFLVSKKIMNAENISAGRMIGYPIGFSLFLLSGYYAVIYTAIAFGVLLFLGVCYRRWNTVVKITVMMLLAVLYTMLFYSDYFDFSYNNEHYETVKSNAFIMTEFKKVIEKLPMLLGHLKRYVFSSAFLVPILCVVLISFLIPNWGIHKDRSFNNKELLYIFGILFCSVFWAFTVNHTVVYSYYARYVLPAAMIYCLFMVVFVYRFKTILMVVVASIVLFCTVRQIRDGSIFDGDRIYYNNSEGFHISTYTTVPENQPIVIVNPVYYPIEHFMYASVSTKSNVPVLFAHQLPDKNFRYKKYTLVCPRFLAAGKRPLFYIRGNMAVYTEDNTRF